jgi:hypothetical protein
LKNDDDEYLEMSRAKFRLSFNAFIDKILFCGREKNYLIFNGCIFLYENFASSAEKRNDLKYYSKGKLV